MRFINTRSWTPRATIIPTPPGRTSRIHLTRWLTVLRGRLAEAAPVPKAVPRRAAMALLSAAGLALCLLLIVPGAAQAVELYPDACCTLQPSYVYVEPQPVVYVAHQPVVYVSPSPQVVVVETVSDSPDDVPEHRLKKPLLTWIEATGGAGMWIIPGLKEDVYLGYHLDAALSLRGFYMGLDFTWIHGMKWEKKEQEEVFVEKGNLANVGVAFGYRFNEDGRVHPELGAMFDTLILDREAAGTALAFGVGATAGLVVDFPLKYGAIVTSIEVAGHRHIWAQNGFYPPRASASVMGSLGYRF
ncbi:MAG: hypothetical protein JRG91_07050 [Deltaproteobacteria bacterium]|nr:hypothetical protein [Deltaproteobacteria bacterium]